MSVDTSKYAIQEVFEITLFDLSTGEAIAVLEDLKDSGFENDGTTVYVQGGRGNAKITSFSHSKMAKMTCSNALVTDGVMEVQTGEDVEVLTDTTEILFTEILTVGTDTATTTHTATGTVGEEIKFAYVRNADCTLGARLTQGLVAAAGVFTYTSGTKLITFDTAELADGVEIVVHYYPTASSAKKLANKTNVYSKIVRVVANCLFQNVLTGLSYEGQIIFHRAKIGETWAWALSADGDASVQNVELEALANCTNNELWSLYIYDDADFS